MHDIRKHSEKEWIVTISQEEFDTLTISEDD